MTVQQVEHSDIYDLLTNGTLFGVLKFTPEGGIARAMVNKTGSPSVKGTVVRASTTTANAVETAPGIVDDATAADPNPATHWGEIGHCLETVTAGSDKLALVMLHFN